MAARKFEFVFLLLLSSCVTAGDSVGIKMENQLAACISTTHMKISNERTIPVLSFDLEIHKTIADCGCKSALGSYTVSTQGEGYRSYIMGGKVGFSHSERKYLPLSSEQSLIDKKELIIGLACAQPD